MKKRELVRCKNIYRKYFADKDGKLTKTETSYMLNWLYNLQ